MVKILVVDDAEFFQKLYSTALIEAGFEVEIANNGDEAVEKMRTSSPRLVFMDLVMPGASGADALVKMKADDSIKTIPVVMLTSISADVSGEDLLLKGAVSYMVKDEVQPSDVAARAKEILGSSQAPLDPHNA